MHGKGATRHPDQRIASIAAVQHGVVAARQLRAAGLSTGQIENRMRVGRLHAVHRGVYLVGHAALTREGRWMAAVLACGADAVLSHRAAGAHHGLPPASAGSIDVTLPRTTGRKSRRGIALHRVASLRAEDRSVHEGIPVTSVARTLFDLASVVSPTAVERAVEESERLRLFDLRAVESVMDRHPRQAGSAVLRAILAEYSVDHELTRSGLERLFLRLCQARGIPRPVVNRVVGPFEVDFSWPGQPLLVECDGRDTHGTSAAFERDRARDAWLTARGYRVVRFTWAGIVRRPDEVAGLLRQLLG